MEEPTPQSGDPGWGPVFAKPHLILLYGLTPALRMGMRSSVDGLTSVRLLFVSSFVSLGSILAITSLVVEGSEPGNDGIVWANVVAAVGATCVALVWWARRRPLAESDAEEAGATYVTAFFLGYALSLACALTGFVSVFMTGELWPMLVGYAFALAGLIVIAPTTGRIAGLEREFQKRGATKPFTEGVRKTQSPTRIRRNA